VSKFGYAIGRGKIDVRVRHREELLEQDANVKFFIYLDEKWPLAATVDPCSHESSGIVTVAKSLNFSETIGEWGEPIHHTLTQYVRSHIWYFAMADCEGSLGNQTVELDYEMHAWQHDDSEFGVESRYSLSTEIVSLVGYGALLCYMAYRCQAIRESAGFLHPVIWALACGAALQCASQVTHLIHLVRYSADGEGLWMLDVSAEILFMGSQVLHATLLIAIARGYTLLPSNKSDESTVRLGFIATLAAHAALVWFSKVQEGTSSHRHHDKDGFLGSVIVFVRVLLLVCFLASANSTRSRAGYELDSFLRKFQSAGALYFLAYPVLFLIVGLFAPYLRQPISHCGLLLMQATVDVWLTTMFLSRGAYFKVSSLSSPLLAFSSAGACKND
jgi:hypothetical protein